MSTNHEPQFADVGDVQEFATTIKTQWVKCRSDGHDMRPFDVDQTDDNTRTRIRKCRNCGAFRHQVIQRGSGMILNTTIEYPPGYLLPPGTGRLDSEGRGVFREMALDAEEKQMGHR